MKKKVFFLLSTLCVFTLSQCSKIELPDNKVICPVETWEYSKAAFIAQVALSGNRAPWFLFTVDKSGDNLRQIVEANFNCTKPVCSRSGKKLLLSVFANDEKHELYVVDTDGSNLTLIDRADVFCGYADWSPDDEQIVYVKTSDRYMNNSDLIIYNISESTHQILQNRGKTLEPKFFPDGKQIAYCNYTETGVNIYKMDIDGNNNRLIINNAYSPKCSPQGDKILYLSSSGKNGSSQIFVANADGSAQKQLTSSVSPVWWDIGFPRDGNEDPNWTPNGKKIVYVSHEYDRPEIFIMNADGSDQKRLTRAELRDEYPSVTPDGRYILFSSRTHEMFNGGVCIMDLDGNNRKVLSKEGIYPVACR